MDPSAAIKAQQLFQTFSAFKRSFILVKFIVLVFAWWNMTRAKKKQTSLVLCFEVGKRCHHCFAESFWYGEVFILAKQNYVNAAVVKCSINGLLHLHTMPGWRFGEGQCWFGAHPPSRIRLSRHRSILTHTCCLTQPISSNPSPRIAKIFE